MPSRLRLALLAWIAACQVYLFAHSQEPLRLDIGDPWSDANVLCSINYVKQYGFLETSFTDILDVGPLTEESYRYTHYPPLAEITYGTLGKLGVDSIGIYRIFALLFSAGAMAFLFLYARRMYGEAVALIATALWQGSLMWLLYADSIHQAPIFQLTTFFGLWGLERAIATKQRRFYVAAVAGAFGCFLTSYDGWIFFPAAVLFTVYAKAGNPFARGNRHFVALCAAGCVAAFVAKAAFVTGAVGWHEFVSDLHFQFLERSTSTYERRFSSALPTMTRRFTQVFSPLVWLTIAYHAIKAIRAPSVASALKDSAVWMLLCGVAFLYVFAELAASQLLPSQVMLPFYALGTALIIGKLLERSLRWRVAAYAWLVVAAAWGAAFMVTLPRSTLADDDVAAARAYLAANDHDDIILNNLAASGQIQWAFDRHDWPLYDGNDNDPELAARLAQIYTLQLFAQTNTETVTAAIFTRPESRYVDKSLWPLALSSQQWSVTGAPYIWRAKSNRLIGEYDHKIKTGLAAVDATRVGHFGEFDLYRIDRARILARMEAAVPITKTIDLSGRTGQPNKLLGWTPLDGNALTFQRCSHRDRTRCRTVLTKRGAFVRDVELAHRAEVMIRTATSCDLSLRVRLAKRTALRVEMNDFHVASPSPGDEMVIAIPRASVHAGINVVGFSNPLLLGSEIGILSIEVERCTP